MFDSYYDVFSVALFIATASIYFLRFRHEDPVLLPYLLICFGCAVANWLGEAGAGIASVAILGLASCVLLHITSLPYAEDPSENTPS